MTQPSRGQAEAGTDADDAAVIQLSRHQPEHFTVLFRRHASYIERYVVRRIGPDAADDIVAETFLLAFRQRDSYNAVNAMTNMISGYVNRDGTPGDWFLLLAEIPGVTVQRVTDVTGQADIAFRFPFTDGITEILLNARTYQVTGYVRNGAETIVTREVIVSGPGSVTPVTAPSGSSRRTPSRAR